MVQDDYIDVTSRKGVSMGNMPTSIDNMACLNENLHPHVRCNREPGLNILSQSKGKPPHWQACSSATQNHQFSLQQNIQHPGFSNEKCKNPRRDFNQEDALPHQNIQQVLERQNHNASIQQQRFQNQPQRHTVGVQLQPQQHKKQMGRHLEQKATCQISNLPPVVNAGICNRRLTQYQYHLRHRQDNSIAYWRRLIAEYYAHDARKRLCVSLCEDIGEKELGVFPMANKEALLCGICCSKSGKVYETNFEQLPTLIKFQFDNGVLDELLILDDLHEDRSPTGLVVLKFRKAVQETVYEKSRVVLKGQLLLTFTNDLKILSWEFCVKHHDELVSRSLAVPQDKELHVAAQKHVKSINDDVPGGVSHQDLNSNCNMFLRNLEESSVTELELLKTVRCLEEHLSQIADVVNYMKDLIEFSHHKNARAMKSLFRFPEAYNTGTNNKRKEMEKPCSRGNLPAFDSTTAAAAQTTSSQSTTVVAALPHIEDKKK